MDIGYKCMKMLLNHVNRPCPPTCPPTFSVDKWVDISGPDPRPPFSSRKPASRPGFMRGGSDAGGRKEKNGGRERARFSGAGSIILSREKEGRHVSIKDEY